MGYSRLIESAQWDTAFRQEADLIFREHVEPAVLEIEEGVKANRLVREIARRLAVSPVLPAASSALGALVSTVAAFSPLAGACLGLVAGMGTLTYSAVEDWQERHRDIQRNQLYFYYGAGEGPRKRAQ
jgi:hypothetical protein